MVKKREKYGPSAQEHNTLSVLERALWALAIKHPLLSLPMGVDLALCPALTDMARWRPYHA